ncbi:salicylate hydroxylase [Pyricularia oryzae 70-15]|uniref:Salicylate hydroxylase n=3 Tax=Pyricularia oryzae TaxID=318829 RepID=G4MX84_PYRO7|nr:salicylate hydroxylase [Pyricularia oryzae 70-15]EHA55982.1 salicylate hydroxylase [Pyricularia oryzae 70-15]ELQ34430.1 salicylate hydroxylase [Pyricularia oryzae Y34]KAI7913402.1 salicylate hydroxylase [Pyricularia oryzae]KAI7922384.1 salicylate hydroxylase [Pyricularia oryzae]
MNGTATGPRGIHVAIVGGGIAGVTLALGLQKRGVSFTLYERAREIREIGAGIGLSPNAERAMEMLDRKTVLDAYKRIATPNGVDEFQWIDGYRTDELIYTLYMGKDGFQGCRRSDLVDEWIKTLPADCISLGKEAKSIRQHGDGSSSNGSSNGTTAGGWRGGVEITFKDGTTATADAVVGCDGIWSRVRELLLGADNPASHAGYTGKYCFRTLVPYAKALEVLGHERVHTRYMYNGPGAHCITYPVGLGDNTVLNVLVALSDPNPWPLEETGGKHTAPGTREEAERATRDFHPTFRKVVSLLPDKVEKWAIFDSMENPAPTYSKGQVCLAGDAAHATGPHLGAGAGVGIEDALLLSTLLERIDQAVKSSSSSSDDDSNEEKKRDMITRALDIYDGLRRERTQWLVVATREAVDMIQWSQGEAVGKDGEAFGREIGKRFHRVWDYDLDAMLREGLEKLGIPPPMQPGVPNSA